MMYTRLTCALPLGFLMACVGPVSPAGEEVESTSEAVSATGVTAVLNLTVPQGGNFNLATLTVTNNTQTTMSNWQVLVSLGSGTTIHHVFEGEVMLMGPSSCTSCLTVFDPGAGAAPLKPGATATVTFSGQTSFTTATYASVSSVDGDVPGTTGASWPDDGVDHIARAVASGAFALLVDYENTKLANTSPPDPNYAVYDGLLLSADMFTLNSTYSGIVFDPNAPGYAFISAQAQDLLLGMQSNPEIATYLAAGLESCFGETNGTEIYTVKIAPFKGFAGVGSGSSWLSTPGGAAGTTDQYELAVAAGPNLGADLVTLSLKTTGDTDFGAAYATTSTTSLVSSAVTAKFGNVDMFSSPGSQSAGCTPFNGPGGTANPYFLVSLGINGQPPTPSPAYLQNQSTTCTNTCTASLVLDPLAYQTPPAQGSTLGTSTNPFAYDVASNWALGTYEGGYGSYLSGGTTVVGTFTVVQTVVTKQGTVPTGNYIWQACGQPGAGC
jgi:hypothetical protein